MVLLIYVILEGRIGNQLFIYSFARRLQLDNPDQTIVIDDTMVKKLGYENLLPRYELPNVQYVHDRRLLMSRSLFPLYLLYLVYLFLRRWYPYSTRINFEKRFAGVFNRFGVFFCENGFIDFESTVKKNALVSGYFQSEKYFDSYASTIARELAIDVDGYPNIDDIKNRNTVCLSIKVQHNVGNGPYDVCNSGYWQKAIKYITDIVDDPLFFVCSDDVDYVLKHLIDVNQFDVVLQSREVEVQESLAAMACCKFFIIGNTTFGWWAQYLSNYKDKIVVAPSRWMNIEMPIDIYQDNWHLIEV